MDEDDKIILSQQQETDILNGWNSGVSDLKAIIQLAFPNTNYDGRSKQGYAVKSFLSSRQLKAKASHEYNAKKSEAIVLEERHKDFIRNNCGSMRHYEMAKIIFKNPKLSNLSSETRVVINFVKEEKLDSLEKAVDRKTYKPPKTQEQAIARINDWVLEGIDIKKPLNEKQKKDIDALIKFCHTPRFIMMMNSYTEEEDLIILESSFIRYCYDKNDLREEELDAYINLCLDMVNQGKILKNIEKFNQMLMDSGVDSDGKKVSMSIAQAIETAQSELHQNLLRQEQRRGVLSGKRSDRIKELVQANASVLNLVGMWRGEEQRKKMLIYAEIEKESLSKEVDRFAEMDDIRAGIFGISKEELINNRVE